jgi:hypothetical protein
MTVSDSFQAQNVTIDGVTWITGGIRLFTVTSFKEGSGVFRLVYANPKNQYSNWATYDPKSKWSYSVQVLPTVASVSKTVTFVPQIPPVIIPPQNCANKTCAPN